MEKKEKISSRGGARAGAGRPKGSSNLITAATLIQAIESKNNKPFEELLAEGYYNTILERNNKMRLEYERMFLGKVVSDKVQVDVTDSEDAIAAKQAAFAAALADLTGLNKE
jgi:hypothetical protein